MRKLHKIGLLLGTVAVSGLVAGSGFAQTQPCSVLDTSAKQVLPGVTLTWDGSFLCANAPDSGRYSIVVTVSNAPGSAEAVEIERLRLSHTTPRPRGQAPDATATASGLPMTVAPGQSRSFSVSGDYELVSTDEGDKANLHLRALGSGVTSGDPFRLGINVHLRGPGAVEGDASAKNEKKRNGRGGPPAWAGGPPPWAGAPSGVPGNGGR